MAFAYFYTSNKVLAQRVVGLPLRTLTTMYFVVELIMGTIFLYFNLKFLAVFLPQFIVLVLFLLVFVPALLSDQNAKK